MIPETPPPIYAVAGYLTAGADRCRVNPMEERAMNSEIYEPGRREAIRHLRSAAGLSPEPGGLPDGNYDVGPELTLTVKGGKVVAWSEAWGDYPPAVRSRVQVRVEQARRSVEVLEKLLAAMPTDGEGGAG